MSDEKKQGAVRRGLTRFFYGPAPRTAPTIPARVEPAPVPRSRVNDGDAYAALAPERLDAEWERSVAPSRPALSQRRYTAPTEAVSVNRRAYEANTPVWFREALSAADTMMARPIAEMRRFVAGLHGLPVEPRDWETPQYRRRHRDAMADTGEVLRRVAAGDTDGARELIMAGARRASSTEVTGVIPTVPSEADQDPTA